MNKKASAYLLFVLSLGYVMAVLDTTGVVLAIPHIKMDMQVSLEQSIWVINAYVLALGSMLLLSGMLTAKYGAKKILIFGMLIFTGASLGCALVNEILAMIVLRFMQGFGAALFMPSSLALLFLTYVDPIKRATMLGIWTAIISVATGTGSFIAGMMISYFGWRGIFLVNIPLGALTVLSLLILVDKNIADQQIKIDLLDNLLLVLSISCLVIYLVEGERYGYMDSILLLFLALALLFFIWLFFYERKSKAPIVPIELLKNAEFMVTNLIGFVVNISLYGIVLILGLYFQIYLKMSAVVAGSLIVPGMVILVVGNLFYARAVNKISAGMLATISIFLAILGAVAIVGSELFSGKISLLLLLAFFALMSLGIGILTPATTTLLMQAAGQKYSGIAAATLNANKQIGGLFGTMLASIIVGKLSQNWDLVISMLFLSNILLYLLIFIVARRYLYR